MRQDTQIEWEILEVEEDEWAEVTLTAAQRERQPMRRQRLVTAFATGALLIALASVAGYRLWQDAEAGIAATERHIGSLVQVETMRQQPLAANHDLSTQVDDVVIKGSTAMVRVVVTETLSLGQVLPRIETRFYERCPAGWRRAEPVATFWGQSAELETPTLHFDFYELDRPFVEEVAAPIDAYHGALRQILGLPPLTATGQITVAVVPRYVAHGKVLADGTMVEPSPYLYFAPPPGREKPQIYAEAGTTFMRRLHAQLRERSMQESQAVYSIREVWKPLTAYLQQWLRDHAAELPALSNGKPPVDQGRFVDPAQAIATLTGETINFAHVSVSELQDYRSDIMAFNAYALFDFLVADRGPDAIAALLAAFGTQDTWPAVIDEAFGMTMDELLVKWNAYIQRSEDEGTGSN